MPAGERAADHKVAAIGKGTFGQRVKSFSPHDHGVSRSEGFEALQIGSQLEKHAAFEAYGALPVERADEREHK